MEHLFGILGLSAIVFGFYKALKTFKELKASKKNDDDPHGIKAFEQIDKLNEEWKQVWDEIQHKNGKSTEGNLKRLAEINAKTKAIYDNYKNKSK